MARFAVGIINYNYSKYLTPQILRLRKYIRLNEGDTLDIIVGDNSRSELAASENKNICKKYSAIYIKYDFNEGDYSSHHALALNELVACFMGDYDSLLLLDHDIFLFDYSNIFLRTRDKDFAGLAQVKLNKTYLHPGIMLINSDLSKDIEFNFIPCAGMDTGGRMSDTYIGKEVEFLGVRYENFDLKGAQEGYEVIDNCWMHFVKGSNWNRSNNHNDRINYLMKELKNISK